MRVALYRWSLGCSLYKPLSAGGLVFRVDLCVLSASWWCGVGVVVLGVWLRVLTVRGNRAARWAEWSGWGCGGSCGVCGWGGTCGRVVGRWPRSGAAEVLGRGVPVTGGSLLVG